MAAEEYLGLFICKNIKALERKGKLGSGQQQKNAASYLTFSFCFILEYRQQWLFQDAGAEQSVRS